MYAGTESPWWRWSRSFDCWWTDASQETFLRKSFLQPGRWWAAHRERSEVGAGQSDLTTAGRSASTGRDGSVPRPRSPSSNRSRRRTPDSRSRPAAVSSTPTARSRTTPGWPGLGRRPATGSHVTRGHVTCRGRARRRRASRSSWASSRWSVVRSASPASDFCRPWPNTRIHSTPPLNVPHYCVLINKWLTRKPSPEVVPTALTKRTHNATNKLCKCCALVWRFRMYTSPRIVNHSRKRNISYPTTLNFRTRQSHNDPPYYDFEQLTWFFWLDPDGVRMPRHANYLGHRSLSKVIVRTHTHTSDGLLYLDS